MEPDRSRTPDRHYAIRRTPLQLAIGNCMVGLLYLVGTGLTGFMLVAGGPELTPVLSEFGVMSASMALAAVISLGQGAAILWARITTGSGRLASTGPRRLASACLWSLTILAAGLAVHTVYRAVLAQFLLIPILSLVIVLMPGLAMSLQARRTVRELTRHAQGY